MNIDLAYRPRRWQQALRAVMRRFNVFVVHRRGGKTVLSIMTLIDSALRTKRQYARYAYLAPMRNQAKAVAWDYLKRWAIQIPDTSVNEAELRIDFPNGSRVSIYGADNPDALRGLYLDGAVVDEVAQMRPEVWGEVLRPALEDRHGWCVFIGTPKGINLFSELYYGALGWMEQGNEWLAALLTVDDTDIFSEEQKASLKQTMTDTQYRQEFLCDFQASSDNQLITLDQVLLAQARVPREADVRYCPKVIGCDVARFGDDASIISKRQGPMLLPLQRFVHLDNVEFATRIAQAWCDWKPDAVFIDAGRGEGVIDHLRRVLNYAPIPVDFGATKSLIHPGAYVLKRDEIWGETANWIYEEACIPDDPRLRTSLCTPTYSYDNRGRMKVESKKDIKDRGLPSPDEGDGVATGFASPVAAKAVPEFAAQRNSAHLETLFDDHGWRED